MQELFQNLGVYLQKKRVKAGLSQGDVAKALGYSSPQFISNFERGLCAPPLPKLKSIINMYDLSPEAVMNLMLKEQEKHLRKALLSTGTKKKKT